MGWSHDTYQCVSEFKPSLRKQCDIFVVVLAVPRQRRASWTTPRGVFQSLTGACAVPAWPRLLGESVVMVNIVAGGSPKRLISEKERGKPARTTSACAYPLAPVWLPLQATWYVSFFRYVSFPEYATRPSIRFTLHACPQSSRQDRFCSRPRR